MSEPESDLLEARVRRNAARSALATLVDRVRDTVDQRSVTARLGDDALAAARTIGAEATDLARNHRWLVALPVLGLVGWLARRPLLRAGKAAVKHIKAGEPQSAWSRFREWAGRKARS
ncbi:hypothetical protein H7F51_04425 [Novosphingobium flavum]|uniref:Uncharacterized protein n=1 Tax=Novosphingobium flavum TaxID=1778672 RepID=A0A7X1FPV6_9SPHN|nr:hypothetical protein [Novosphingobium flavum]MBC2664760.1 hypothetical protein [Novosphingobium flavum]